MSKELSITPHNIPSFEAHAALDAYVAGIAKLKKHGAEKYDTLESALFLPKDADILAEAKRLAKQYAGAQLQYVIVIGIGGSNLGTKAVYDALRGAYDPAPKPSSIFGLEGRATIPHAGWFSRHQLPKLFFLDTLSEEALRALHELLEARVRHSDQVLINIVSKSGTTVESVANFELLYQTLAKRFPDIASRVIATTDRDSALWKKGKERGFGILEIPAPVGGRFSVFSAVGLFPLLVAGIDVEGFCRGGGEMLERVLSTERAANDAIMSAEEIFAAQKSGCVMLNLFFFHPELESLGKWERQLVAESLGKEKDLSGNIVHAGITPIVSIASVDLHSMAQLYFGGPRDKFTMLIHARKEKSADIPKEGPLAGLVAGLSEKSTTEIMSAIFQGVKAAYNDNALPCAEVELPEISAYTLGAYMEWRMATVIYLAKLMNVNAFDQPNVEDYKKVTRGILGSSK
ncbi:MAG: hypothetical protein Q7S52_01450 [bacterium]|nr:hypothetical protein [bacterium]